MFPPFHVKPPLRLTKSVLYPPSRTPPQPVFVSEAPKCKGVFVDRLPEKATEEIIREVFEKCGKIIFIRMSNENFCHILFANEDSAEEARSFSGYRMKIEDKDNEPYTGVLFVAYAPVVSEW